MSMSNDGEPMGIEPNQALSDKQQRGGSKILNALLANEDVLYTRLRDFQRKIMMTKLNNWDKVGGQNSK